jgi:hypothetical protein
VQKLSQARFFASQQNAGRESGASRLQSTDHFNGLYKVYATELESASATSDPARRAGLESLARARALHTAADAFDVLQERPRQGQLDIPALARIQGRSSRNSALIEEVRAIAALEGREGLVQRTRIHDDHALEKLCTQTGADKILELHAGPVNQSSQEKTVTPPRARDWQELSRTLSDSDLGAQITSVREQAIETQYPGDSEDRDTRVKRATINKIMSQIEEQGPFCQQGVRLDQRLRRGIEKDSAERGDYDGMMDMIQARRQTRTSDREMV